MTKSRDIYIVALSPADVEHIVRAEQWGRDVSIVHVGIPVEHIVLGLPDGLGLYGVRVIFRQSMT
jgi:hypothetical protein